MSSLTTISAIRPESTNLIRRYRLIASLIWICTVLCSFLWNRADDIREKNAIALETALVAINDEFIQIFNSAPDGMHIINRGYTVIRANRALMTLTGHKTHTVAGQKCFEILAGRLCHTPDCPLTRILAGEERVEVEAQKTRTDGSVFPCLISATAIDGQGAEFRLSFPLTQELIPTPNPSCAPSA